MVKTQHSHTNLVQNKGEVNESIAIAEISSSIKLNLLAALDSDLSSE